MSLQHAAQHLAAQGRGPDKQLVHMSPREVAGLQALAMAHGGSLSINPETGLPEAGFLDNMLPMILGAGAMALTGGAAAPAMTGLFGLGMPATIGLGVGALQTARTGDLGKGLMAGLGAYGGAGLAGGLMAAGGAGAAGAAGAGAAGAAGAGGAGGAGAAQAAGTGAMTGITGAGSAVTPMPEFFSQSPALDIGSHVEAMGTPRMPFSTPVAAPTTTPPSAFGQNLSQMGRGLTNLTEAGGREAFMSEAGVGGGKGLFKYGAAAGLPLLLGEEEDSAPGPVDREQMRFAYNPGRVENPMAGYPADYRGEYAYFRPQYTRLAAGGGLLDRGMGGSTDDNKYTYDPLTQSYKKVEPPKPATATGMGADRMLESGGMGGALADAAGPGLSAAVLSAANEVGIANAFGNADSTSLGSSDMGAAGADTGGIGAMGLGLGDAGIGVGGADAGASDAGPGEANGGLLRRRVGGLAALAGGGYSHLGDYSDGGRLLRGPGDGVSDSIPATIGNKRPARLADGEFVIPARIVSELGNGSTEAGARKLYAMMDRVQRARGKTTGKGRVAKNTRADKYLPA